MKTQQLIAMCGLLAGLVLPSSAAAPLGTAFTYQGQLKNGGTPTNGLHDFRFQLYDALAGGTQVGTTVCVDDVKVANGLFTVDLDFGASVFDGDARFLEISVRVDTGQDCANAAGFTTLTPRGPLTTAPHASYALNAAQLDGLNSTAFLQSIPVPLSLSGTTAQHIIQGENASMALNAAGVFGAATDNAGFGLNYGGRFESAGSQGSGVFGLATDATGITSGVFGSNVSTSGRGVFGLAGAATGTTYGGRFESNSTSGRGVFGLATAATGSTYGVHGQSASPQGSGVFGESTAGGGSTAGVFGRSNSTSGLGVFGWATAATGTTFGVRGLSESSSGRGVFGLAGAATGTTYGGRFESNSTSGRGVYGEASAATGDAYGVYGRSDSADGRGVFGEATANSGFNYGGRFESASANGIGVYGLASADTGQTTRGVYGLTFSTGGHGVFGEAAATSGFNYGGRFESYSTFGTGVLGFARAGSGTNYGVRGRSDSTDGRGVYGHAANLSGTNFGVRGQSDSSSGFDFYASGAGTNYGSASSIRWKSNVKHIDEPLAKIARLRGVTYDWDAAHGGHHDVGMIAEEVGKVLPEIVQYEENGTDAMGMDYSMVTPLLVEAVNALRAEKDAEITALKEANDELRARLKRLESIVAQQAAEVATKSFPE